MTDEEMERELEAHKQAIGFLLTIIKALEDADAFLTEVQKPPTLANEIFQDFRSGAAFGIKPRLREEREDAYCDRSDNNAADSKERPS